MFGKAKKDWFSRLLELPNGIPSHDTFGRIFARLDPVQFGCGRLGRERNSGWNWTPSMKGWSSMGCQKDIATTIIDQGADYVLALKENQPQLHQDVTDTFEQARQTGFDSLDHDFHETVNKGHGRIETRRCWSVSDPDHLSYINDRNEWTKLTSVVMIESERIEDGKTSIQARYYISSLPNDARVLLASVRTHWGIENSVHWVLDVAFGEDDSRVRQGNAAQNLSVLRRMALNMLKRETTSQGGVAAKRKRAGWDEDYLLLVLAQ